MLEQYTPGDEYQFNYEVSTKLGNTSPILVQVIDMNLLSFGMTIFTTAIALGGGIEDDGLLKTLPFIKRFY